MTDVPVTPADNDEDQIDAPEAAKLLGMTLDAFRALARRDNLPASKYSTTGARLFYRRGDVRLAGARRQVR